MSQKTNDSGIRSAATCAISAVCTVIGLCSGCSMPMSISYTPIAAVETLVAHGEEPRAYVARFSDERSEKKRDRVGAMQNMYGTNVRKLVTADDFGMILAEATTDALRKAGLQAELHLDRVASEAIPAEESAGYDLLVGGRMTNIEVVSRPGWDTLKVTARVVVDLYVKKAGCEAEWLGPIEGTAERREIMKLSSQALTLAVDSAIQDCMRNMIRHLRASGSIKSTQSATVRQ